MKRLFALLLLLAWGVGVAGSGPVAHATPDLGPDPDDIIEQNYYGNSYPGVKREFKFAVSRDGYTDIYNTRIIIYLPTPTGTITLQDVDLCYNDSKDADKANYDQTYTKSTGLMTSFTMTNTGTGTIVRNGYWDGTDGCFDDVRDYNVSGSTKDPATGMYPYFMNVEAVANGQYVNLFKVIAPAGAYVSQDSSIDTPSLGMQQAFPIPTGSNPLVADPPDPYKDYSTWTLRFGPDCTVTTSSVQKTIEIYDDDNAGTNFDVQPKPFHVRMQEYTRAGAYVREVRPDNVTWNGVTRTTPGTDSAGGWDDSLVVSGAKHDIFWTTANKQRYRVTYTFLKDKVYRWKLFNVYYDNTLQIKTPFDSIFYYRECQLAGGKLKAGMGIDPTSAKISVGQTAVFTPTITVSSYRGAFTANCAAKRTMYSPSGSPTPLPNPLCQTTSGSSSIAVTGNGPISLQTNSYTVPNSTAPGTRICDEITITSPTDSSYFAVAGDKVAENCVTVIGHPYLKVGGNDVWAGSQFDYSGNKCSTPVVRTSKISSWVNGGVGAFSRYGLFALGAITEFGSANAPGGDGLTYANTPSDGTSGAATRCIPDYYDILGASGDVWPGIGSIPANAGKKKYFVNGNVTLGSGIVPAGTQVILVVNGNVTISGPTIWLAGGYTSATTIASFWVVAQGNIYIQEGVTNLDGFYVAQGTAAAPGKIHTCVKGSINETYNPLTAQVCSNGLEVYGALLAEQVYWQRTRGTTAVGQSYAESVQFDPALYLGSPYSPAATTLEIQDSKELPPVY